MSDCFLLRGRRAILREIIAAWVSLTVGSVLFVIVFAKYSASGEGVAAVAALVLSIPVSAMLLQSIRSGQLKLPELSIPKGVPESEWKMEESESFAAYWKSLNAEEKEGLQWLASMLAANALVVPPVSEKSPGILDQLDIVGLEEKPAGSGHDELIVKIKDKRDSFVVVKVDRKNREIYYTLRPKEAL